MGQRSPTSSVPDVLYITLIFKTEECMKKRWLLGAALILGILVLTGGIALSAILIFSGSPAYLGVAAYMGVALSAGSMLALSVCSFVKARRFKKTKFATAESFYNDLLEHKEETEKRREESRKKLISLAKRYKAYLVLLSLLCILYMFFAVGLTVYEQKTTSILSISVAVLIVPSFLISFSQRFVKSIPAVDFSQYEKEEDYPELYALAKSAAERMGVRKDIRITFLVDNTVGVAQVSGKISLQVGAPVLAYLTREEFYCILLHEFSHVADDDGERRSLFMLADFFNAEPISLDVALLYPALDFCYELELYDTFSNIISEERADRSMSLDGNAQNAANAMAKIAVYDGYNSSLDLYMGKSLYEDEENARSVCSMQINRFFEILPENVELWEHIIEVEIQARSATHPIPRERIRGLGVDSYNTNAPEDGGAWREECTRVISSIDEGIYKNIKNGFEDMRRVNYLEPKERLEKWESDGKPTDPERIRGVIDDLMSLLRHDEAEELCNTVIERERGGLVDYAHHVRGCILYLRKDARAIPDLYAALEGNTNYTEDINLIGELCCKLGLETELEEYRSRTVGIVQNKLDEEGINELSIKDDLSLADSLPPEVYQRNLDFILSAGEGNINKVYLVYKRMDKNKYSYVYVIDFNKKTKIEDVGRAMNSIFEHLDNSPEDIQYSLFMYGADNAMALRKVKGSCIFDIMKEENQ